MMNQRVMKTNQVYFNQIRKFSIGQDFDHEKDYYKILGVGPKASEPEIKRAYYKLAQEYHPDKTGGQTQEKFKEISGAYGVIGDA